MLMHVAAQTCEHGPGFTLRQRDIDIADERRLGIAVRPRDDLRLETLLRESGMGFVAVPSLDRKAPSTEFSLRGRELSVELLTPMRGRPDGAPVFLPSLGAWAEPVRHVDFLLDDAQIAVLLHAHGILVNVPAPGRFALHKLVVAERRAAAFAGKARRDRAQAEMLLEVLLEDRPGDLILAAEAATAMGERFSRQLRQGLGRLEPVLAGRVREIGGLRRG